MRIQYTAQEIRTLRLALKMTTDQFADALGVSQATISRWENSKHKPSRIATGLLLELEDKYLSRAS